MVAEQGRAGPDPVVVGPRELWRALEPVHAVVHFAPEVPATFEAVGLRGFWRSYFAARVAPMGRVTAGPATAALFGFAPGFVARAVPAIWDVVPPEEALAARLAGVDVALRRLLGPLVDGPEVARAAELLREALPDDAVEPRPLYAANLALPWPEEPHLALWHGATVWREHRGDGHVALLVSSGLHPCEAHLLRVAATGVDPASIRPHRGWDDDVWDAAARNLGERGLVDGIGQATPTGAAVHAELEERTDELAVAPVLRLGAEGGAELLGALAPVVAAVDAAGAVPYPNPMGLPAPEASR